MGTDSFIRRAWRALEEYWTPQPLTPRMRREVHDVAANDDIAAHLLREHDTARQKVTTHQRRLFATNFIASIAALAFMTCLVLFRLRPTSAPLAVGVLLSLTTITTTYLALAVLSWPSATRRQNSLCISSAAAAGRCSNAVADRNANAGASTGAGGVDLAWRRRIGTGIADTAEDFARCHRRRWYAPAARTPLNLTTTRLTRECAHAIKTLIERTLTTEDLTALRDDLWRLHMRVMAADFGAILALQHPGVTQPSRLADRTPTWQQALTIGPGLIAALVALFPLIWGTDSSLIDLLGHPNTTTPTAEPGTTTGSR